MGTNKKLRQKTWAVFIRPYTMYKDVALPVSDTLKTAAPCTGSDIVAQGGEAWMLYKQTSSFPILREIIKEVMDDLGFNKENYLVVEIIPTDYIVTPLA